MTLHHRDLQQNCSLESDIKRNQCRHTRERAGPVGCRERLGGLLKYYECEAA